MNLHFEEYKARKIINIHKHVDGPWFWGKYTAHPYIGCRSGCDFCYLRGSRYLGQKDPDSFDTHIKIKANAAELFSKEIQKLEKDIISVGDWQQPAEDRYRLSRKLLEIVLNHEFPLFIVERSPLLTRDLDLIKDINERSWVGIQYSISTLDEKLKRAFEPRSPGVKRRFEAISVFADAGISVGVAFMPIFPFVGDDKKHLEDVIRAAKDHGASFIVGGGLTMDGHQATRTLHAADSYDQTLGDKWREFYRYTSPGKVSYSPPRQYNAKLALRIRELCEKYGLLDRMPRYIIPGPLEVNKRLSEKLFLKTYDLEIEGASDYRIWAYRKAAWTVDELSRPIDEIYKIEGINGIRSLPNIGEKLSSQITKWLDKYALSMK